MTKWNLSDNVFWQVQDEQDDNALILVKDVKEFIRKLKDDFLKEFNWYDEDIPMEVWKEELVEFVNKLAGSRLIE